MESDQSDTSVRDLGDESLDNEPDDDDLSNRQNDSLPTSVLILPLEDAVDDGHIDRYDMLDDVDEVFSLSEKMVHYVGGHIMRQHWTACKAVLVFQAGANVCKLATMTKEKRAEATLEAYKAAIAGLDTTHFCADAISFFLSEFRDKTKAMNGVSVYRSFQGTRAAIRNQVLPIFPTNFNSLKSGRGFHESVNAAITKEYRKTLLTRKVNPMTKEEAEQDTPPMFWEYKNKPWYYSLATKIFRRHLQLAPNVKDVAGDPANAPVSKAAQKRLAQFKSSSTVSKRSGTKSDLSSVIDVDAECAKRQKVKRKEAETATAAMNTNLSIRMGQMQELNLSLNFLDRMRTIIGEDEYAARAKRLMSCLPDPETFRTEVINLEAPIKSEPTEDNMEEQDNE